MIFTSRRQAVEKAGKVDFDRAVRLVQESVQDSDLLGEERAGQNREILENVMAGIHDSKPEAVKVIEGLLEELGAVVEGMDHKQAAYEIYKEVWGLGPIEEIYNDPSVNEIQVNAPDRVYVIRNLKLEAVPDVRFRDDNHVLNLITRMVMHDRGVALNRSSPTIESMRKDGTRITATCPPVTEHTTLAMRKHLTKALALEEMVESGVFDEKVLDILKVLVRGRANIAVIGGVGSGKTTLVRSLFGEVNPRARVIVLETDRELYLKKNYPDRNIVEMEEHPEAGRTLKDMFRTTLRYSPIIIIVGEFRGEGEATEAVRACERGHDGSMTTAHFSSAPEFVGGTARLLLKEGFNLPKEAAEELVTTTFNVVVKMFGDSTRGIIKLESVTEIALGNGKIECRDLALWVPADEDYLIGEYRFLEKPSERLLERFMRHGVPRTEVEAVWRKWS